MAGAPGGRAAAVDPNRHDTVEDARRRGRVRARIGDASVQGELTLLLRRNAGLAHDPTPARQIRLHPLCERPSIASAIAGAAPSQVVLEPLVASDPRLQLLQMCIHCGVKLSLRFSRYVQKMRFSRSFLEPFECSLPSLRCVTLMAVMPV